EYDLLGRKIAHTDPQGNETRFSYDELNRVTKIVSPKIYDDKRRAVHPTKTYTYEKLGTIVTETDENGFQTKTSLNALGHLTSQPHPQGTKTKRFYDLKGNCIKEIAPNDTEQHMSYDAFDRLTSCRMKKNGKLLSKKILRYNSFHLTSET